jgi:hypothetical protein
LTEALDPWVPQGAFTKLSSLVLHHWPMGLTSASPLGTTSWLEVLVSVGFSVPLAVALTLSALRVIGVPAAQRISGTTLENPSDAEPRRRETVFVVYGIVFLAFYLASSFAIDPKYGPHEYRLLGPPVVLLLIPAARSLARGLERKGPARRVALVGCVAFLLATSVGSVAFAIQLSGQPLTGRSGEMVRGLLLHRKYEADLSRAFALARLVPDEHERFEVFRGIGWGLEYRFEADGDRRPIETWVDRLDGEERRAVVSGIRWGASRKRIGAR